MPVTLTIYENSPGITLLGQEAPGIVVTSATAPGPPGPQGEQGPIGPGGSALYLLHEQTTPTASITVTHGFGKRPQVTVLLDDVVVDSDIEHVDVNNVSFVFPSPTTFTAIFTA